MYTHRLGAKTMEFIINFITDSTINNISAKEHFLFLLQCIHVCDYLNMK